MLPGDIEVSGEARCRAIFQDVHPPGVSFANPHVIGNDIQDHTHMPAMQFVDKRYQVIFCSQLGIQVAVIDNVITMQTSRSGRQN